MELGEGAASRSTGRSQGGAPGWLVPSALFVGVATVFALTASREEMHLDAHAATVEAWHLAATGSPWLENSLTDLMASNPFITEAPNGHVVAHRMAGPVILGVPFYWLLNRSAVPEDFSYVPGGLAAASFMALATVLIFLSLRRLLGDRLAAGSSLVFAFATPTWSVSADQLWTHTATQLGIAGAAYAASRRSWWLAGAFLGLGMLGRPHLALVAAILGVGMTISQRRLRPAVWVAVPALGALLLLSSWNRWMFGAWGVEGAYPGRTAYAVGGFSGSHEWSASSGGLATQLINYLGFWVAPDRGFLIWTPAALLLLPALVRHRRHVPAWSMWLLLGGLAYTTAQLRINYFPGGFTFWGYRHGLELLTCALPALAAAAPHVGPLARRLLPYVIAAQFAASSLGAITYGYFVHIDDVWTDNSLWLFARQNPLPTVVWFVLCLVTAELARRRVDPQDRVAANAQIGSRRPEE